MEEKLINFIKGEYLSDDDVEITPDTKLISSGLIDSFSLVSLQTFIEKEFKKRIPAPGAAPYVNGDAEIKPLEPDTDNAGVGIYKG